ncbi:MAG: CHASE3 domain-containing protein [Bacteroidota bacterium]|nr:CHASE3 domain-containing protein [Bacteroidota bacterium]
MVNNLFDKIANRTRIGFLAAFVLLLISYILTFISTQKVITQSYWINHTNEVIHNLDNVLGYLTKGESLFRGYIITSDKKLLNEYGHSEVETYNAYKNLKSLTTDNIGQQRNLDTLHNLIDEKFIWIGKIVSEFSSNHKVPDALLKGNDEGNLITGKIENFVHKMQASEKGLWDTRSQRASAYSNLLKVLDIASIAIAIILTLYSFIVFNKENKAKLIASQKAAEFQEQLQSRVKQLADLNEELIELRSLEKYSVTGRIARTIAHEVRNPLTNINLATEQLRSELESSPPSEMLFTMIARNSERINQLVSDLLNSTRVSELSFESVSINSIIDESLSQAYDRIKLKKIKVIRNYNAGISKIYVDVDKIKIAFLNIIVNAIEAMNDYGILAIRTEDINNRCVVKFTDTGKGMSKSEMQRLFEPYFTTKEKGNGLGLANTQNIILGHNGSISAQSEEGKGTTFTVIFNFA